MFFITIVLFYSTYAIQPEDYVMLVGGEYDSSNVKYYYLLNYCHMSQIKRRYNSTHIENKVYRDSECTTPSLVEYLRVSYIFNIQNELETKGYYIKNYYVGDDCDDKDKTIPIYGYRLYTEKHCNSNEKGDTGYFDLSEERTFLCVSTKNHDVSSICEDKTSGEDVCQTRYIGQCYRDSPGYYSVRVSVNREKFETTNASRDAIRFLVVFIFLFILI